jgi:NADH-quinone oxidoreductase subunit I
MIKEILKGLAITGKHLGRKPTTICYPEVKKEMPPRFRGRHHLRRDENGLELCIGCHMCAVVCPATAIYLEATDNTETDRHSGGERYAKVYQIDYLRCIFCGFCVDACPTDALVMGQEYEMSSYQRKDFVYGKDILLDPVEKKTEVQAFYHNNGDTDNSSETKLNEEKLEQREEK